MTDSPNAFQKVESFFKGLGSKIHNVLVSIFGQAAIDKTEADIKKVLSDDFRQIFLDGIAYAATLQVPGTEKKAAAFDKITSDLANQGKALPTQLTNFGIELVLSLFKARNA
jgi:hypothetical protein